LQDSYLRWAAVDLSVVHDSNSRRREEYVGPRPPEPILLDDQDPSTDVVLAESVSMTMLVLLKR
jgi:RNA polymerase sigma-70 factor, ECF subfamily